LIEETKEGKKESKNYEVHHIYVQTRHKAPCGKMLNNTGWGKARKCCGEGLR
jgi:hypothetical protein